MVEVALDARSPLDRRRDVRLPSQPREQAFGPVDVAARDGSAIGPQDRRKCRRPPGHLGQTAFGQCLRRLQQGPLVGLVDLAAGQHVLLQREEPTVDD